MALHNRKFYNYTATVYRVTTQVVRWSIVEVKTELYKDIIISFYWNNLIRYWDSILAAQTDLNVYIINLYPEYEVEIWDIILIDTVPWEFKISNIINHHNSGWRMDNRQVFITKTEEDDDSF